MCFVKPKYCLTQLCSRLETNTGISLSPEGNNQRFNSQTVQFLHHQFSYSPISKNKFHIIIFKLGVHIVR